MRGALPSKWTSTLTAVNCYSQLTVKIVNQTPTVIDPKADVDCESQFLLILSAFVAPFGEGFRRNIAIMFDLEKHTLYVRKNWTLSISA